MDKETLSNYGWIVICVLVLAVLLALASPFGLFVSDAVKSTTAGLFGVNQEALGAAGIEILDNEFYDPNKITYIEFELTAENAHLIGWESGEKNGSNWYTDCDEILVIPETFHLDTETDGYVAGNYKITTIGNNAFEQCSDLTSVTIPNSVTSIGDYAFSCCSNLTPITIPGSVKTIGNYAFSSCNKLSSVNILDGVTSIGNCTFSGSGLSSITIPDSVTSIGSGAFMSCSQLTSITIPGSVTTIQDSTFMECYGLKSITFSEGVTSISSRAFHQCNRNLTSINISDLNVWANIEFDREQDNPLQYGCKLYLNGMEVTEITASMPITSIGNGAFYGYSSLTSVTIQGSVTSIGDSAFSNCSNLTAVTIQGSVTSIGDSAFSNCSNLTAVTISDGVTSIGDGAFDCCTSLTSIIIPNSVTSIGEYAFHWCDNLTDFIFNGTKEQWNAIGIVGEAAYEYTVHCTDGHIFAVLNFDTYEYDYTYDDISCVGTSCSK